MNDRVQVKGRDLSRARWARRRAASDGIPASACRARGSTRGPRTSSSGTSPPPA